MSLPRLRSSEWLLIAYFTYVAILARWFFNPGKAWLEAGIVAVTIGALTWLPPSSRDLAPAALTLAAYREMDWFTPAVHDLHLERAWVVWDRRLLDAWRLRAAVESAGVVFPSFLELCYLLVYMVGPVSIALLLLNGRRRELNRFWLIYLAGTLGAYALFPYFPSEPPWRAFAGADLPQVATVVRRANLWILRGAGIHSSVFPSAHVSSVFAASWGLLATIPKRKWIGGLMVFYACSVALATLYGRYHYAVDAAAGVAVSLLALLWGRAMPCRTFPSTPLLPNRHA